jgi:hypothetical protein
MKSTRPAKSSFAVDRVVAFGQVAVDVDELQADELEPRSNRESTRPTTRWAASGLTEGAFAGSRAWVAQASR